jgi:hypothetical protein
VGGNGRDDFRPEADGYQQLRPLAPDNASRMLAASSTDSDLLDDAAADSHLHHT